MHMASNSPNSPRQFTPPPDDLTLPQFIFGYAGPIRPERRLDIPCLIEDETGRKVFMNELKDRTNAFAAILQSQYGIAKDDVVCFASPNHTDYGVVCWAVHTAGGILAPMSPGLTTPEMEHQLRVSEPKLIVAHPVSVKNIQEAVARVGGTSKINVILIGASNAGGAQCATLDELIAVALQSNLVQSLQPSRFAAGESRRRVAFLCFSSGTTGPPKAVAVSHYNVLISVTQIATHQGVGDPRLSPEQARFRPGDICTGVLPFFHIYGLAFNLHFVIFASMTIVVTASFNFEKLLRNIVKYEINQLYIVPPQATLFAKHPAVKSYDVSGVHCVKLAAAPVSAELTAQLLKLWPDIHFGQGYGMTEAAGGVAMWPLFPKLGTHGACGTALPAATLRIIKADGTEAAKGESGELQVKGDLVALGYYKNPEATKETFLEGGWLRTGDEVMFLDGEIVVVDRIKEIIKVKGMQVSPAELEGHLLSHTDIADVGVVGKNDDYAGQLPVAFIVLKGAAKNRLAHGAKAEKALKDEIMKYVEAAKSRYKWLAEVHFLDAIPRNPSGKILRRVLQQMVDSSRLNVNARL